MSLDPRIRATGILTILIVLFSTSVLFAGGYEICGYAQNLTSGRPASGDQVILIRLDRGMQEEARATVDAQGSFKVRVQYPEKQYLVRVLHGGVSYDQPAHAGGSVSISVFDAVTQVREIAGSIEILRTGTNGSLLHVSDMYEIWNQSSPPITESGSRTFEVYLPAKAKISSVLAANSGKIGVMIRASRLTDLPGHYAVDFPLRPGATKFAFNYDLPYDGHVVFRTRHQYAMQQFAVMIPPAMKFSSASKSFVALATGNDRYQVRAVNGLKAGEGPGFDLSGNGSLPSLEAQTRTPTRPTNAVSAPTPLSTPVPQATQRRPLILFIAFAAVLLAACTLLFWRSGSLRRVRDLRTRA